MKTSATHRLTKITPTTDSVSTILTLFPARDAPSGRESIRPIERG